MDGKKVLCLSVMQSWGGGEEFLLNLFENLTDFEFVVVSPDGQSRDKFERAGIKIYVDNNFKKIRHSVSYFNILDYVILKVKLILGLFTLFKIIRKEKISLILANGNYAALYAVLFSFLSPISFVVIQHLIYGESKGERIILRIVQSRAAVLVSVSKAVHSSIKNTLGSNFNEAKNIIIPHGIQKGKTDFETARDTINLGFIGRIIRTKGLLEILNIILKAQKKFDQIRLHIFGEAAEEIDSKLYLEDIKKFVSDNRLENKVIFHGFENSKMNIYRKIDIVINFSQVPEAFSLILAEAMAHRRIVISANTGGPAELIENNVNGFLINERDEKELERIVTYCISNFHSPNIETLKDNAVRTIIEKYSMRNFSDNYTALFNNLLN